jgi:hypothetical protein
MKDKTFSLSLCSALLLMIFTGSLVFAQQREVQELVDLDHNLQSFKIAGEHDYDYISWFDFADWRTSHSMASGDIDHDGLEDLVFASPFFMIAHPLQQPQPAGKVYVVYGREGCTPFEDIDLSITPADVEILANKWMIDSSSELRLGASVAVADVNGDRFDDIIIGQPVEGAAGGNNERVYIVYGAGDLPQTIDLGETPLPTPVTGIAFAYSPNEDNSFGCSVACGDFDGDGFKDILIGNYRMNSGPARNRPGAGEAYVIFGFPGFQNVSFLDITGPASGPPYPYFKIFGELQYDHLGVSVTSGDLSHDFDGFDDIVISAPARSVPGRVFAGEAYVIFGGGVLRSVGDVDLLSPPPAVTLLEVYGSVKSGALGTDLAAGNVNGGPFEDLVMGETGPGSDGLHEGWVWAIEGGLWLRAAGVIDLANPPANLVTAVRGIDLGDRAGEALAVADIEGDYHEDIMAGATWADSRLNGRINAGEAYIVEGKDIFFNSAFRDLDQPDPNSTRISTYFGVEVGGISDVPDHVATGFAACDLNGDGIKDFVMGVAGANDLIDSFEREDCGEIYVFWSKTLLRNAEVTSIDPMVPSLDQIFPLDPINPVPIGDLYKRGFKSGYFDPQKEPFVISDYDHPLVFYQVYDPPQNCNTLKLHKHVFPEIDDSQALAVITF